jgi:hypothetical protein
MGVCICPPPTLNPLSGSPFAEGFSDQPTNSPHKRVKTPAPLLPNRHIQSNRS